jgi:hypothetical protein
MSAQIGKFSSSKDTKKGKSEELTFGLILEENEKQK